VTDLADNKRIVVDYYTTGFAGNPEKAAADYLVPGYIQHNPTVADGPDEFIRGVHLLRDQYPNMRLEIKRVIAEGDLVATIRMSISNPTIQKTREERLWTSSASRMARSSSTGMSSSRYLRNLPTTTACSEAPPRSAHHKENLASGRRAAPRADTLRRNGPAAGLPVDA